MANSTKAAPRRRGAALKNRKYGKPPVHEVIVSVHFQRALDEKRLLALRERLAASFSKIDAQNLTQVQMGMDPTGQAFQGAVSQFAGWLARDEGWVLQAGASELTLHLVRPGAWPSGEYAGWSVIYERFLKLHASLADVYGPLEPKRAGLRYLNRIAIPQGEPVAKWLTFPWAESDLLRDLYTFNVRLTWARAGDADDLSATIGLAKITILDPVFAANNEGVLLDIDVFNLWIPKAPLYEQLPDWFQRAHKIENQLFESLITQPLRERFEEQE